MCTCSGEGSHVEVNRGCELYICFCVSEPDHGMEPGLAHHFFLQLMSGVVRGRVTVVHVGHSTLGQRTCNMLYNILQEAHRIQGVSAVLP